MPSSKDIVARVAHAPSFVAHALSIVAHALLRAALALMPTQYYKSTLPTRST
jgi:hypothetical protein